ncbi:unnamed protein product [Adineta ricciae]|uniref:LIM zinc-binding domain-containing protein n=1 Tax=Adineta ricciae TaxID=249248 RepID=A0A816BL28_ADIRI|nr:unnamed protein product [Adineta ricciae]
MAHAFDSRNDFTNNQQKTFIRTYMNGSDQLERLSSSPTLNHPPPTYEETVFDKTKTNPLSNSQEQISITSNAYSPQQNNDFKPPPPLRVPRLTSTTNHNYIHRSNLLPQYPTNGMKTSTTYLNTTQLYITQPSCQDHSPPPPPPPPRYPLYPPVIPPRNQKNSVTIPNFNSPQSSKTIYRSPVNFNEVESALSIENDSTIGEYFGECRKCGEIITSFDDPCDILGETYHSACAICVICGRSVKNKHFFVKDQLYCEEDFLYTGFHQALEHCVACNHLITDTILQALGESYHFTCFRCSKCSICLDGAPFMRDKKRNLFCVRDYHMTYGPRCDKCSEIIFPEEDSNETIRIISMGKTFHVECYQCEDCSKQLGDEQYRRCYPLGDRLLCQECCHQRLNTLDKF